MMASGSNWHQGSHGTPQQGSPCLEPKHKIFLSHSGIQKNFTAQLCEDLTRVNHFPFFDKRLDSLPKGEEFPRLLIKAAQQCWVAILVLSEDFFTRSKWPMIELNEFVQAQAADNRGLKLLPLYFGLKLEQLKDAGNQKRWRKAWGKWARKDKRIDVGKWVQALSAVLGPVNGMEYDGVDEVAFRKNVVEAVCKLIPADVNYDVSHVQARPRLCEAMRQRMGESYERPGCRVVGLFGMAGMGKTTMSKVMCFENYGEFGGKVCHIEFDGNNYVDLRKKVLRELTGADQEHLPNEGDKLSGLLKDRMHEQKVFLSLDNVLSEDDIEEANKYLDIEYMHGSMLLVTSRSLDVLKSLRLRESDCMEMPELEEQDATNAFLYYARCNQKSFNDIQLGIIKRCVDVCKFTKSDLNGSECGSSAHQYLPLALKVWGTQLGHISEDPLRWVASLETIDEHKFNHFKKREHPLFSLLRQGYDRLDEREQHIFLDLAIFIPRRSLFGFTDYNIVDWLSILHGCSKYNIERSLNALTRMALLEDSVADGLLFKIHDLYVEFARVEAEAGPFEGRRILYEWKGSGFPRELVKRPGGGFWSSLERLGFYGSEVMSLAEGKLDRCCNVEMLQLYDCHQLEEVDVGGMDSLISLGVVGCERLQGENFRGVEKLENLAWFRWRDIDEEVAPFVLELSSLTALQVLHLNCVLWRHKSVVPPNVSGCINLRELTIDGFHNLESLPNLSKLCKLEKISFRYATEAIRVLGLSSLTNLKVLSLYWCPAVKEFPGLCDLIALETLDLTDVGVAEIRGLEKLVHLRNLIVSSCRHLTSLGGLEHLTLLRRLDASESKNLKELPDCSKLKELKVVDLSFSGVCIVRQSDFERLAKHRTLKIEGCGGLLEPLVVWLLLQRGHLRWEAVCGRLWWCNRPLVADHSASNSRKSVSKFGYVVAEAHDVQSNRGEIERNSSIRGFSAKANHAWSITREDFVHYMAEVVLLRLNNSYLSLANPKFCEEEILGSARILGELDGGISAVVRALCEDDDLGILSLVFAKYLRSKRHRLGLTRPLCARIIRFLRVLVQQLEANEKARGREEHHLVSLIVFILEQVTRHDDLALELGHQGICEFLRPSRNYSWVNDRRVYYHLALVDRALQDLKLGPL